MSILFASVSNLVGFLPLAFLVFFFPTATVSVRAHRIIMRTLSALSNFHVDSIAFFLKDGFIRKSPNELFGNLFFSSHEKNYVGNIDLSSRNIKNIFFRFAFEEFISPDHEKTALENFSKAEFGKAIMSSLLTVNASKWYNYPYYEMQADIKPLSLKSAMALKIHTRRFTRTMLSPKVAL